MDNYEDNSFTLGDMASQDPTDVSLYNAATTNEDIAKHERLAFEKQRKLDKLSRVNQGASLDKNSFSVLDDGSVVSNANKIFNSLSDNDFRDLVQYSESQYNLTKPQEGEGPSTYSASGEAYDGRSTYFYGFGTRDKTNDVYKAGIARGDLDSPTGRYIPGSLAKDPSYGWEPGSMGVDVEAMDKGVLLPSPVATMLEAVGHGRENALANRLIKDKADDPFTADDYGSGYSEYYTNREGFYGTPTEAYNEARGKELFDQYINVVQNKNPRGGIVNEKVYLDGLKEQALRSEAGEATVVNRLGNAIDAAQRTLYKEAVLDFSDWVGEGLDSITGGVVGWDNGTEEEKTAWVNETFGFNPYMAEEDYAEAQKYATNIADAIYSEDKDVQFSDVYELVKIGITTPEMLGDSVGFIGSFFVPFLGWGGKAAKADKAINAANDVIKATEKALKAGQISKDAAKAQVLAQKAIIADRTADITTLNKFTKFAQQNAGLMQVSAGNVNDQIEAYTAEFGEAPSAGKVAQMMATETLMLSLDRWADLSILKAPAALKGTREAFSALAQEGKTKVLAKTVGVGMGLIANMGKEAGQEYLQEIGQEFNVKFNFDDNGDFVSAINEAGEVLLDKEMQIRGITGAGLGAGGAVQFAALGAIPKTLGGTINTARKGVNAVTGAFSNVESTTPPRTPESAESEAEVARTVQRNVEMAASATTPIGGYYAAQGSSNPETRAQASATATAAKESILNGTNEVFNSDEGFDPKLKRLDPLIEMATAEDPSIKLDDLLNLVAEKLKPATAEEQTQLTETVTKAHRNGLEFASIKPLLEVSEDVSTGAKGFVTYYTNAKAALAEGDTKAYEENLANLDYFYNYEDGKLERINSGVTQVRGIIEGQVDNLVKMGKAPNRQAALKQLTDKYVSEDPRLTIKNSALPDAPTTDIKYSDVAMNMRNENYNKGIFKLTRTISSEVESMGKVYNSLLGNTEEVTVPEAATTQDTGVDIPATSSQEGFGVAAGDTDVDATDIPAPPPAPIDEVVIPDGPAPTSAEDLEGLSVAAGDIGTVDMPTESQVEGEFGVPAGEEYVSESISVDYYDEADIQAGAEQDYEATLEDYGVTPEGDYSVQEEQEVAPERDNTVQAYQDNKAARKENSKRISERRAQLRSKGIVGKAQLQDAELVALLQQKQELDANKGSFVNVLKEVVAGRLEALKKYKDVPFKLYTDYKNSSKGNVVTAVASKLFEKMAATGFTLTKRTSADAMKSTRDFAANLLRNMKLEDGNFDTAYGKSIEGNPLSLFMFDADGKLDYNTVEAMQAAAYEFLVQDASNLRGTARTTEEIAELIGIPEEEVSVELANALANGGITRKLAAADVGGKVIKNLGLTIESVQEREALATAFGMMTLLGLEGDFIEEYEYIPTPEERNRKNSPIKAKSISFLRGTPTMFKGLKRVRKTLQTFEDTLGVALDKERTYRREPTAQKRKVTIHRAEYQEAPKDHQDVVNRLENTAFRFNSGNEVLMEMFSDAEGNLDTKALVNLILGSSSGITNKDGMDRYEAQKEALMRSLLFFQEAKADVKDGNLFFNWFIAKNHRIHLDSNRINPQNDKHLARWLLTAANSVKTVSKSDIEAVINGKDGSMEAKMFAYAIVQAFDGAKSIPGIDKDNEAEVLAAAKNILENTSEDKLKAMAKDSAHIGHAALAISNIRKYMDATEDFESDMVLEVDGLTNGFAFRSMQFPIETKGSPFSPVQWLEKVGMVGESSSFYNLESMNGARSQGQEDVYISVGQGFNNEVGKAKAKLDKTSAAWVKLFEKYGKLPDFSDSNSPDVKKFIRNLMKSPVMIFNYAAGLGKIAGGLVNDQIMGTGYLSGRGLIDLLTEKTDGNYTVSKEELVKVFGESLGTKYHNARIALGDTSLLDLRDPNILVLRTSLRKAISGLYSEPLTDTLENLFAAQTTVNGIFTNAAQFMFDYFKDQYELWRLNNPEASEADKIEFLRDMASFIPGVAGASSDDQLNKVTFLKNVLEPTSNDVVINVGGKRMSANTVSRGYGDPGVGPAVLTVLSLDSSVLAKTINDAYKGSRGGALPIHDAIVLGISEANTIKSYNRNFYSANRGYSIAQEFVNAVENFAQAVPDAYSRSITTISGDVLYFADLQSSLNTINDEIQTKRGEIFNQNMKSGQLVGPEGTMVTFDVEETKEASKAYLSKAATTILGKFQDDVIKDALPGKEYKKAVARLYKMLEGCK